MGGCSVVSGDSSDWEVIQNPFSHQPSLPPSHGELQLVIREDYYDDNPSIFPPSEHEDLPLLEECNSARSTSPPQSPLSSACSHSSTPREQNIEPYLKPSIIMNEIGTRMYSFGRSVFQFFHCSSSRSSSIFPAAMVMLTLFACAKTLQWRSRLLLLVREKDQRISQLLHRISHMNEILSARRKVPVLRIS